MILENIIRLLRWCEEKIRLSEQAPNTLFKEGEIWWCRVGMNVGVEIYGKGDSFSRPVLIIKKLNKDFFIGVPLTSKKKEGSWFAPVIFNEKEGVAVLSQIKALDGRRLISRIGVLNDVQFSEIKNALFDLLF
jgi:mRNA interferase MazF